MEGSRWLHADPGERDQALHPRRRTQSTATRSAEFGNLPQIIPWLHSSPPDLDKFWRTLPAKRRSGNRYVIQHLIGGRASKQETAAAHIAPSDEFKREL
jgi:hypothetical protein